MEGEIRPIWNGRASNRFAAQLNKIFSDLGLPYKAVVEGKPETYQTVRYGWITSYDFLPVYVVDEKGEKVKAELSLESIKSYDYSGFGVHEAYEKGIGRLKLPTITIEFDYKISAIDYRYGFSFENARIR